MQLESIKYSEYDDEPRAWDLDMFAVDQINLIVGKNASGKTRTLRLINNLALLLCGERKPSSLSSSNFNAKFKDDNDTYQYVVNIKNGAVIKEEFQSEKNKWLTRSQDGTGTIFYSAEKKHMAFQTDVSELAFTSKRDSIQHPFIEPLYQWAKSVHLYEFGTSLGGNLLELKLEGAAEANTKNTQMVVGIYRRGEKEFADKFKTSIKNDMKKLGYHILDIGVATPSDVQIIDPMPSPGELVEIWIQEDGLQAKIEHRKISQGMFRALSLIIQLNYSTMTKMPSCTLVDDIGEGLDHERSCALIELVLTKIQASKTQLIMTTNDRFVMNKVPLEMWTVLHRQGSHCKVFNIKNAKDKFEEFRFTGLNNFDFFASDYLTENKK